MVLLKVDPKIFDQELDFFPLYQGIKPSSMGLKKMNKFETSPKEENKIFLFGPSFQTFRKNKEMCRNDDLSKYYQSIKEYPEIIEYIINTLSNQNKEYFTLNKIENNLKLSCHLTKEELVFNEKYELIDQVTLLKIPFIDAFDALSMQISEDLVIHHVPSGQLNPLKSEEEKRDFSAKIHLCHCNGWDAKWAINQTFNFIHKGVPRIEKIIPNAIRMMMSFFNKDVVYERVAAISFKTSTILNRHEEYSRLWVKEFNQNRPEMSIRVERQTVVGFPKSEAFLFSIRTYIYDMNTQNSTVGEELKQKRLKSILDVFKNPDDKSYAYNIILKNQKKVLKWLGCK